MKSCFQDNDIEMYSTHNERKSVVAERFIITLKNKMYKYMTSITKNLYVNKLDLIVNKYNSTYHSTIKVKSVDVKPSTYIDFNKKNNMKYSRYQVGDHVKIYKYKKNLQKVTF